MSDILEPTSLKGIIQSLHIKDMDIVKGVVISESPLEIRVMGDEKLILTENIICLPRHLTNYKTTADIKASGGNINVAVGGAQSYGRRARRPREWKRGAQPRRRRT